MCKGSGLRHLAHHVVKALMVFRISRLEKVPWSVKDTGRRLSQHYPIQDGCPHRGKAKLYKDPFFASGPFSHSSVSCFRNPTVFTIFTLLILSRLTCRPIVKLCRRSRLFLHLVTLPFIHLPFNHLLQCFQPLQIS